MLFKNLLWVEFSFEIIWMLGIIGIPFLFGSIRYYFFGFCFLKLVLFNVEKLEEVEPKNIAGGLLKYCLL